MCRGSTELCLIQAHFAVLGPARTCFHKESVESHSDGKVRAQVKKNLTLEFFFQFTLSNDELAQFKLFFHPVAAVLSHAFCCLASFQFSALRKRQSDFSLALAITA